MTKAEAESKLEYLDTPEELAGKGLRRIKRRHFTKPGEITLKDCFVNIELSLDAEVLKFYDKDSTKINAVLREAMEKTNLREELLNDTEFVKRLKEKLAA